MEPFSEMAKTGKGTVLWVVGSRYQEFYVGHSEFEMPLRHPGGDGEVKEAVG